MTDLYAVVGNPIEHSLSPIIHHAFAKQTGEDIDYVKIKAPLDGFQQAIAQLKQQGAKGCNITLPFKEIAFKLATCKSNLANSAGAANVFRFEQDGSIYADNTDGVGLVQDLIRNHDIALQGKRVLILGAGGAVRGIIGPLLEKAPAQIIIANRTKTKAIELAAAFNTSGEIFGIGLNEIPSEPFDLIIHATSIGLNAKKIELPLEIISPTTVCYDLLYGKNAQFFLEWAKKSGATQCFDGIGMLVEQAAASFYLWRGIYPDTKTVIALLKSQ